MTMHAKLGLPLSCSKLEQYLTLAALCVNSALKAGYCTKITLKGSASYTYLHFFELKSH